MSDFTAPSASPFVLELMRLNDEQVAARKRGDTDASDDLAHEIALLLRLNAQGRVDEYFQAKAARNEA